MNQASFWRCIHRGPPTETYQWSRSNTSSSRSHATWRILFQTSSLWLSPAIFTNFFRLRAWCLRSIDFSPVHQLRIYQRFMFSCYYPDL